LDSDIDTFFFDLQGMDLFETQDFRVAFDDMPSGLGSNISSIILEKTDVARMNNGDVARSGPAMDSNLDAILDSDIDTFFFDLQGMDLFETQDFRVAFDYFVDNTREDRRCTDE
jgi:hypothetical protein